VTRIARGERFPTVVSRGRPLEYQRSAVEFGVEIGEHRGVVRVPRRVSQRLLPERPTPERCVEAYYLQRTRFETILYRKLSRRELAEDGNVEIKGLPLGLHPIISDKIWLAQQAPKIVVRRNVHQRHPLRDEHFDLGGLRRYGAQPHSTSHGGGWPAFGHRPYVCGDGVGVPWAICRRGVKVRGNPLASSFIASCLNTRPKASSSSASFGPTLPLANRKQRSAWTCRCIASDIVSPVSIEHPPDRHDPVSEAYGTVSRPQSNSEMVTEPLL
jgi:hypothetical protein